MSKAPAEWEQAACPAWMHNETSGLAKAGASLIQAQRRDVNENPPHVKYPVLGTRLSPLKTHLAGLALFLLLLQGYCKHRPKEAISSDIRCFVLDQHGCPLSYLQQPSFARQGLLNFQTPLNRKLLGTELWPSLQSYLPPAPPPAPIRDIIWY